jgi:hypothetical protein
MPGMPIQSIPHLNMHAMANTSFSTDDAATRRLVWFSRILRWTLGLLFIGVGIYYFKDGAWPALLVGGVLLVTGFFRPKRCLDENGCEIPQ